MLQLAGMFCAESSCLVGPAIDLSVAEDRIRDDTYFHGSLTLTAISFCSGRMTPKVSRESLAGRKMIDLVQSYELTCLTLKARPKDLRWCLGVGQLKQRRDT